MLWENGQCRNGAGMVVVDGQEPGPYTDWESLLKVGAGVLLFAALVGSVAFSAGKSRRT